MKLFNKNILYYPGCFTQFHLKEIFENYKKILEKMGVNFIVLDNFRCCGIEALESGYRDVFNEVVEKTEDLIKENNVKKVLSNCPRCVRTFNEHYKFKSELLFDLILKNIEMFEKKEGKITYYDGAELGRKLNVIDEPRKILTELGFEVVELPKNKINVLGCGVGGGLKRNSPRVANAIAKKILSQVKTTKLVVADPLCYLHLKENAELVEVLELSEVLL